MLILNPSRYKRKGRVLKNGIMGDFTLLHCRKVQML